MAEALRAKIYLKSAFLKQRGQFGLKFQVEGVAPTNHSSCPEIRTNDLSCGIRMWAQVSFVLSQSTHLTGERSEMPSQYPALHYMHDAVARLKIAAKHSSVCPLIIYHSHIVSK